MRCITTAGIARHIIKQKMKMILSTKEDCVANITRALERTSLWRKAMTVRWPDDPRNMRAAQKLDQLALDALI